MEKFDGTIRWNNSMEQFDGTIRWNHSIATEHSMEQLDGNIQWNNLIETFDGTIRWNHSLEPFVSKFFGIYMFFKIFGKLYVSKNWNLYFFYKVVQATVHGMASYDGTTSILGNARVIRMLTKRSEGPCVGGRGCSGAKELWFSVGRAKL